MIKRVKFKKLWLSMLLTITVSICIGLNVMASEVFAGGDGSVENPYQICTKSQLNEVRNYLKSNFILMNDIIFDDKDFEEGGEFYNEGQGWQTIGRAILMSGEVDYDNQLSGTFDGNNHSIINLKQNITKKESNRNHQVGGLFDGVGKDGTVKNLTVEADINANITSGNRKDGDYAIIVATNYGTIENCKSSGKLTVMSDCGAGGVTCYNECGLIVNCENDADISVLYPTERYTYTLVGGIVGSAGGEIVGCINKGNIKVNNTIDGHAGGVMGGLANSNVFYCANEGKIESSAYAAGICAMSNGFKGYGCYNVGQVSGDYYVGGLICDVEECSLNQCYNIGTISGNEVGGLAGNLASGALPFQSVVATDCYFLDEIKRGYLIEEETDGMTAVKKTDVSNKNTFAGFDFDNIWNMTENGPEIKDTVFDYYKNTYILYDVHLGGFYDGSLSCMPLKCDYYVGDKIDLTGAMFSAKNTLIIVKGNQKMIDEQVESYAYNLEADPVYLDENTIYIENEEDKSRYVRIVLIDPSEITVKGFDSSKPTTKKQTVELGYYRFTGTYKIEVAEKPHVHIEDAGTVTKKATCTEDGTKVYKCTDETCQEILRTESILAPGHVWDNGVITKKPTTLEVGIKTYSCEECGSIKTENIDKLQESVTPSPSPDIKPSAVPDNNPPPNPTVKVPQKQKITVSKIASKTVVYKAKSLKLKKATFKISAKAKTKISYSVNSKSKKYISVSKSGKVTVKKGCKKGTYKINVTAGKTNDYAKAVRTITIKVK